MSICDETICETIGPQHSFPSLLKVHESVCESGASVETFPGVSSSSNFTLHFMIMMFSPKLKY